MVNLSKSQPVEMVQLEDEGWSEIKLLLVLFVPVMVLLTALMVFATIYEPVS